MSAAHLQMILDCEEEIAARIRRLTGQRCQIDAKRMQSKITLAELQTYDRLGAQIARLGSWQNQTRQVRDNVMRRSNLTVLEA